MSMMFGSQPGPSKENGVKFNQSVAGFPVPAAMGRVRVQQSVLWVDGFNATKVSTGGGKGGGGKTGDQYDYTADVLAALCDGGLNGVLGIGDVWSGQSWLPNTVVQETYTISGGTPSYTPANAAMMTADHGVSWTSTVSQTANDLAGANVLSGTMETGLQRVSYGSTLSSGQYSVDGSNKYYFSAANAGQTVKVNYSFPLGTIKKQENVIVPSGKVIQVGGTVPFAGNVSVIYNSPGSGSPTNGNSLTLVTGTPTATGTYSVSGSAPANYTFAPGDVNAELTITYLLDNSSALPAGTQTSLAFQLIPGTRTPSPWALLTSKFPGAALGYPGIAAVAYAPMDLGFSAQVQQNRFDVITADGWGGGVHDCNPVQCILQVITNPRWGLGSGPVPFPTALIDLLSWGTGNAGGNGNNPVLASLLSVPSGQPVSSNTATSWFAAQNFFISPLLDKQDTAASVIGAWLEAGACGSFLSEGLWKLVPYGGTSVFGNGHVWLAPSTLAATLDDDCFIAKPGSLPVRVSGASCFDGYSKIQVGFNNRTAQYAPDVLPETDPAVASRYGVRIEDVQEWDFITTLQAARFAGSMRVQRACYVRGEYAFTLGPKYRYLECMDLVGITTGSNWNQQNGLQLVNHPVRIIKIVDHPDGSIDVTAEDLGPDAPNSFNKVGQSGPVNTNQFADPGNTIGQTFVAPARITGGYRNQLCIAAAGINPAWGGCNVLISRNGSDYTVLATIEKAARIGYIYDSLHAGADPDTTFGTFRVVLAAGSPPLLAGAQSDADAAVTLDAICLLNGTGLELLSHSAVAACSGPNPTDTAFYETEGYTNWFQLQTYLRRGLLGTTNIFHSNGVPFVRMDDAVLYVEFNPSWVGQVIYLKYQSFNTFGNSAQDETTLTAFSFTVPSTVTYPTVNPSTGVVTLTAGAYTGGIK